ncbi:MAG TPA: hypothetical protein ENN51_00485 [candidate division WOR-3 bacterium]|uniref:Uncharacterized protein n=1 Tax=candidate division WOR-3 bacterium TaxID=2052148 RepID=A0A7V0XEK5_UNCW3|nr:hypothetical protein [candidate division WOR-3 bacterium]
MNTLFRLLLVAFIALSGVLVYVVVRQNRARSDYLVSEVSADSIIAYEDRADSLERVTEILEADLPSLRLLDQPAARFRLDRLRGEIAALRTAVERYRVARTPTEQNQAYRECILLYGRATGICDALFVEPSAETDE